MITVYCLNNKPWILLWLNAFQFIAFFMVVLGIQYVFVLLVFLLFLLVHSSCWSGIQLCCILVFVPKVCFNTVLYLLHLGAHYPFCFCSSLVCRTCFFCFAKSCFAGIVVSCQYLYNLLSSGVFLQVGNFTKLFA